MLLLHTFLYLYEVYRKEQMYTFHLLGLLCPKIVKQKCFAFKFYVLKLIKAHVCNAKFQSHLQSILTSQSGVTLFFISRLWMWLEAGPCTVMGGTPRCWGWVWGAGKKGCAFTANEALWVTVERVLLNWWVQRQLPSSSLPHWRHPQC